MVPLKTRSEPRAAPAAPVVWPTGAPPYTHVLAKPTGAICNLGCEYCYFLAKEAFYPGSRFRMADALLESYIRQYIEAQRTDLVTLGWQGGEPTLMGLDFFERSVAYARKHARPGMRIEHSIQTNGTLLDDAWCAFFREHGFLVGLSLDGPRELHDIYRLDKGGAPTFDKVMRGARLLEKHGVEFNILVTVNAANADHPLEVYRFVRDELGTQWVQFIPIVERINADGRTLVQEGETVTARSVGPEQWGRFLNAVFDEWLRRDVGAMYVSMFEAALASWLGLPPAMCVFAETCGNALAIEHNGDVYACDHFVEPRYLLGNIQERHLVELVASEKQRAFGVAKRETLPRYCRDCAVRFACHGECPKNRFGRTPDAEPGLNYLCAGYKAFFTHIDRPMQIMAHLYRRGRAPSEIMPLLAAEDARVRALHVGRNEACPCGSGKKFKHCHGRRAADGDADRRRVAPVPALRSSSRTLQGGATDETP
jgi:uncharacterized protein